MGEGERKIRAGGRRKSSVKSKKVSGRREVKCELLEER